MSRAEITGNDAARAVLSFGEVWENFIQDWEKIEQNQVSAISKKPNFQKMQILKKCWFNIKRAQPYY